MTRKAFEIAAIGAILVIGGWIWFLATDDVTEKPYIAPEPIENRSLDVTALTKAVEGQKKALPELSDEARAKTEDAIAKANQLIADTNAMIAKANIGDHRYSDDEVKQLRDQIEQAKAELAARKTR